jgi:hypothetical protein
MFAATCKTCAWPQCLRASITRLGWLRCFDIQNSSAQRSLSRVARAASALPGHRKFMRRSKQLSGHSPLPASIG